VKPQDSAAGKRRPASAWLGAVFACARRRNGSAVVEFAVVLPVLLLMVFGILDFGRAMNYDNDATHLANEGARWAVVNANPGGSGSLQSYIKSQGDTSELRNNSTVCVSFPNGSSNVGDPVSVTVAVNFTWLPFIGTAVGGASTTMTGKAVMRLEQPPTNYGAGCA
jgi:Flp pilus assembly protein TadG